MGQSSLQSHEARRCDPQIFLDGSRHWRTTQIAPLYVLKTYVIDLAMKFGLPALTPFVAGTSMPLVTGATSLALSNAERQRRYIARLKKQAKAGQRLLGDKVLAITKLKPGDPLPRGWKWKKERGHWGATDGRCFIGGLD